MNRIRLKACIALTAIAALLALAHSGALEHGPVLCPLRATTGLPCGSCGLTRATAAITRGEFANASSLHATSLPLAAMGLFALTLLITEIVTGRPALRPCWRRHGQAMVWITLGLVAIGWGANLARHFRDEATAGMPPTAFGAEGNHRTTFSHS